MQIIRFYDTPEGGSKFQELEISFTNPFEDEFQNLYHITNNLPVESAVLVELPDGLDQSWHNAPTRQFVFVLEGQIEVETTDGSKCSWDKGDLFFADDLVGKGHLTRVMEGVAKLLFLRLSDEFELEKFLENENTQ